MFSAIRKSDRQSVATRTTFLKVCPNSTYAVAGPIISQLLFCHYDLKWFHARLRRHEFEANPTLQ